MRPGDRVGRFIIERQVGSGAMGVVYAAEDPHLGRRVALKLLHPDLSAAISDDEARGRITREAQTMARLSHPNVVTLYEIGSDAARVFVAMEFCEGTTLEAWLKASPRTSSEIVSAFLQAGAGLAAAHRVGIVHRDFKPQNVLVDHDGRIRVTDFGLARQAGHAPEASPRVQHGGERLELTRTGAILGTPAYMAPEQLGGAADLRSDQFSFCVALYEALLGARPFEGRTPDEVFASIQEGPGRRPRVVPARLWNVLRRGLQADPSARFPSFEALISALTDARPRPHVVRWRVAAGVLLLLSGALVASIARPWQRSARSGTGEAIDRGTLRLTLTERRRMDVPGLSRVAIGDPAVADIEVSGGSELIVEARAQGTTTLLVWNDEGDRHGWTVQVLPADVAGPSPSR